MVKELVENALDAGATRIRVEVRGGGRDFIAVSDDGSGMSAADARLALSRHATSKISSSDDLEGIATYGFRGEALPAIASVSRLCLRTRTREAETALEIAALNLSEDNQVGHPLESHRVSGVPTEKELKKTDTTFEGELNCLTCHNPHKGRSKRLFRWNAGSVTQACLQCHPK